MSNADIIRAWKDLDYRSTLCVAPTHPAGAIELADPDLGGGAVKGRSFKFEPVRRRHFTKFCTVISTSSGHGCC